MSCEAVPSDPGIYQVMLATRLTDGIVVRRVDAEGERIIASNVPPLRHASPSGFAFGDEGPGASDLALACVQALLERMDYIGPADKLWDGSRVYTLAHELREPFLSHFIAPAQGDELHIPWNQALGWMRKALLARIYAQKLSSDTLLHAWRLSVEGLPDPPPQTEMDRADATRVLRAELLRMTGDASVLSQFLGMVG